MELPVAAGSVRHDDLAETEHNMKMSPGFARVRGLEPPLLDKAGFLECQCVNLAGHIVQARSKQAVARCRQLQHAQKVQEKKKKTAKLAGGDNYAVVINGGQR